MEHAELAVQLATCMQAAGLVDAFNSSTQELTMFAPLNSAFQNLAVEVSQNLAAEALLFGWMSPTFEPLDNGNHQLRPKVTLPTTCLMLQALCMWLSFDSSLCT